MTTGSAFDADYYHRGARGGFPEYIYDSDVQRQQLALKWDAIAQAGEYQSILFVGCAMGFEVKYFRARNKAAWGLDVSEYAIANAEPEAKHFCKLYDGSNLDGIADQQFDIVAAFDVLLLVHLNDRRRLFSEMRRVCKGSIIFRTIIKNDFDARGGIDGVPFIYEPFDYWAREVSGEGFGLERANVGPNFETIFHFRRKG